MTKTSKLAVDTIVDASTPAAPAVAKKPYVIQVFAPTTLALQQIAVHCRDGYVPDINSPIEIFAAAGTISVVMVLGDPDKAFVDAAAITTSDAIAVEEGRFKRLVEEAAARQIEQAAQAEKAAKRAKLISEQRAALAALEAAE